MLKEKQAKRKEIRAEQERKINQHKKEEEEKLKREEAERKAQEEEEARKAQEEADAKKKESQKLANIAKQNIAKAKESRRGSLKKEQLEHELKVAMEIRINPLNIEDMDSDEMRSKAEELFNIIVKLETEKYELENMKMAQSHRMNELKERQQVLLRQKALKKGMDPEAFSEKHPPLIRMYSKYERRTDTRTYTDRQNMYQGGWEVMRAETLDSAWKDKYDDWTKRPARKLPMWFGERPGKKTGEPDSHNGELDEGDADEEEEEEYEEEEEEEEEEYESEEEE